MVTTEELSVESEHAEGLTLGENCNYVYVLINHGELVMRTSIYIKPDDLNRIKKHHIEVS